MCIRDRDKGVKFLIPVDNRVGDKYAPDCNHKLVNSDNIPDGWMGLDIGPKTEALFADAIKGCLLYTSLSQPAVRRFLGGLQGKDRSYLRADHSI